MTTVELLFGDSETIEVKDSGKSRYAKVDVPDSILKEIEAIREHNRAVTAGELSERRKMKTWGVSSVEQITAMTEVLYSAADVLGCTVIVTPVIRDASGEQVSYHKVSDNTKATHIRVSVGERRGRGNAKTTESVEE